MFMDICTVGANDIGAPKMRKHYCVIKQREGKAQLIPPSTCIFNISLYSFLLSGYQIYYFSIFSSIWLFFLLPVELSLLIFLVSLLVSFLCFFSWLLYLKFHSTQCCNSWKAITKLGAKQKRSHKLLYRKYKNDKEIKSANFSYCKRDIYIEINKCKSEKSNIAIMNNLYQ